MIRIAFFLLLFFALPAQAQSFDYKNFSALPIQHEGRIKPIDSFARGTLEQIAGSDSVGGMAADAWLAQTLFDPAQALEVPIFRLLRPDLLSLPARKSRLYSYSEIAPALLAKADVLQKLAAIDQKEWSEDQRELARIQDLSVLYGQLLRSFSFMLKLNLSVPESLAKAWKIDAATPPTLLTLQPHQKKLDARVRQIVQRKGGDPAAYTDEERAIVGFAFEIETLKGGGRNNVLFRIIPGDPWLSPWEAQKDGAYLQQWLAMANAYGEADIAGWNTAGAEARKMASGFTGAEKIPHEIAYNTLHPLPLAMAFYLAAFLVFALYALRGNNAARIGALFLLIFGGIAHLAAIILRVIILSRPPVGTLYESILFVALVCVFAAAVFEILRKDGNGIMMGSAAGLLLLFCARSFSSEDSMGVLVAVLNTNFWLGTHVLCITMGYAFCLMTSMCAHVWLFSKARGESGNGMIVPLKILAILSLLFTAVGTILGGIWADQSWGRFWGWDPKENGALLIVLWLIWLLHGQIGGQLSRALFVAGLAALSMIVALAWFGVNLLATGLHSYGFISGVAGGLFAFCAIETALIGWLHFKGSRKVMA